MVLLSIPGFNDEPLLRTMRGMQKISPQSRVMRAEMALVAKSKHNTVKKLRRCMLIY